MDGANDAIDGGHSGHGHGRDGSWSAGHGVFHGGHMSFAFHGGDHCAPGHEHSLAPVQALSPQGKSPVDVKVPTVDAQGEAIRGYVCHISRHGSLDIVSTFAALAAKFDLIRIDGRRPGLDVCEKQFGQVLDYDAWTHAQEIAEGRPYDIATHGARTKPNGWFPGVRGDTTLVRENWQVGKRKGLIGKPEFDPKAGTLLEISVIIWRFLDTCDYETKLEVRVVSSPEWNEQEGRWGYRSKPFDTHQRVAIKAYTAMMETLLATKPSTSAVNLRAIYDRKFPPQPWSPEGTFAMTEAELRERELQRVHEDALNDQVARDNQPGLPAATASNGDGGTADLEVELDY